MCKCPFLTTSKAEVLCFKECCFFSDGNDKCPFKIYEDEKGLCEIGNTIDNNIDSNIDTFMQDEINPFKLMG